MKLIKIIRKNYKILIRSKSSALVVILGPLLLILLVGVAFSNSSTFTLNIGVFSPEKNNLTESYIDKLSNENYRLNRFSSEEECIESIKSSRVHTCIIFPKDFELSNEKSNEIKFYIDQTKQNFVYAVVNTLTSSFTERSSELSLDLTSQIVNVISQTQNTISKNRKNEVSESLNLAAEIIDSSNNLQSKLTDNKVDVGGVTTLTNTLDTEEKVLRNRITAQYNRGANLLNLSYAIYNDATGFGDPNQTYENRLEDYDSTSGYLWEAWNESIASKDKFVNASKTITSSVTKVLDAVEDSETVQQEVVAELKNGLSVDIEELKNNLEDVDSDMSDVLLDIDTIQVSSAQNIVSPITTKVQTVVAEKSQLDYLFPSLIILLIMFISILLSSTLIIMEKNSKAYFRNFTTPTNDFVFILATFLTSIILMIVQIMIVILIAGLIFKTPFLDKIHTILLLIFLVSSVFVLVGMAIGYVFNTEQTAMIGAISVGSLILLTSDMILPIENMPLYVQNIAKYNPFILGADALRKIILFSSGFLDIWVELLSLGIAIVIISVIIVVIQQLLKARFFNKFSMTRKSKPTDRPENIIEVFKINQSPIKDEKELYRFVKRISKKEFKKLVYKRTNRVADFAEEILRDDRLAKNLSKMRTRWGILKVIEKQNVRKEKPSPPLPPHKKSAKKNIAKR